jgi:hypothetical protein
MPPISAFPPAKNEKLFSDMGLKGIAAVHLTIAAGDPDIFACRHLFRASRRIMGPINLVLWCNLRRAYFSRLEIPKALERALETELYSRLMNRTSF